MGVLDELTKEEEAALRKARVGFAPEGPYYTIGQPTAETWQKVKQDYPALAGRLDEVRCT